MGSTLYTNQFAQGVAIGDIDLGIVQTGTLTGILSANQATTVLAGAPAKIDTTIAVGSVVNFLQALQTDLAIGFFKRTTTAGSFVALDIVEIVLNPAPVIWLLANGTITPGATVYNDSTGAFVNTTVGSNKARGIALDYAVNGQALRVMITNPLAIAS